MFLTGFSHIRFVLVAYLQACLPHLTCFSASKLQAENSQIGFDPTKSAEMPLESTDEMPPPRYICHRDRKQNNSLNTVGKFTIVSG